MTVPRNRWRELPDIMQRWGLTGDGQVLDTPSGCIVFVRRAGERAVLKVRFEESDERSTAAALAHFAGRGAVRLLGEDGKVLLLERAQPGIPLSERVHAGFDDEATEAIAGVIDALHVSEPPPGDLPKVDDWAESFERHLKARGEALPQQHSPLPLPLVDRAQKVFDELCRSQGRRVLLHGDLHHDNVLYAKGRGWLAINPKGVIGEPAFDTGAMLRNPTGDVRLYADARVVLRRVRILADLLDLEPQRIVGWGFSQAVLSAIWSIAARG